MISLLFSIYLILVGIWFLFSIVVFAFTVQHHPFSVTAWVVVVFYILIASQIFMVTFTALARHIPLRMLFQF